MKLVIDSNMLPTPELRAFLSRSSNNFAIITDYAAMEAYKGGSIFGLQKSLSVVRDFPRQTIILKSTNRIRLLNGKPNGLQKRLIDHNQTKNFITFIKHTDKAVNGNDFYLKQIADNFQTASAHINKILIDSDYMIQGINLTFDKFTKIERNAIRNGHHLTTETTDKIIKDILAITGMMFSGCTDSMIWPNSKYLENYYIFRFSLCVYLMVLDWVANGGAHNLKQPKMQNDMIDMSFVTYATYFDGLLSKDDKSQRIYSSAKKWLRDLPAWRPNPSFNSDVASTT